MMGQTMSNSATAHPVGIMIRFAGLMGVLLLGGFSGCSDGGPSRLEISGMVTLDGEPLDQGSIDFRDTAGELPTSGAMISAGVYHIPHEKGLLPGRYQVSIDSADPDGQTASPTEYSMSIPVSRIPLKYNGKSELTAEVSETSANRFDFALESGT
jgi:hypothetical protein